VPSAPGQLVENSKTSNTITLAFGAATDEDNFTEYKIYYGTSSPVTEGNNLISSSTAASLGSKNYLGQSSITISDLSPDTIYYFNIWAYDIVGHKTSSTPTIVQTNEAISTPGALFYLKNDRVIYYRLWNGTSWEAEQSSGNLTGGGENIRQVRALRSDTGAKIGLAFKTWDGTNQKWWGAVYRFAADDFVNVSELGSAWASATHNDLLTACLAPLSGGEFLIARNNNASNGAIAFSWDALAGWTSEGVIPGTGDSGKMAVMNGCELVRRPGTDNYLFLSFDDDADVGAMYYYGASAYDNSASAWSAWTELSDEEDDINNFTGGAYFDPSNNGRGVLYFSDSADNNYALGQYFTAAAGSINYGGVVASPATPPNDWGADFVHGEFAADPGSTGLAYFAGRDSGGELNIYRVNGSNPTISWSTVSGGDNISSANLYSQANRAQKPFALSFFKSGQGVVVGDYNTNLPPFYAVINTSANSVSATSSVTGAGANIYPRARLYDDPNEDELLAVFQNDDVDYSVVFWDPGNNQFYNAGNQAWTELASAAGPADADFENTAFGYAKFNSGPNLPANLGQYKNDGATAILNSGWTNEASVKFSARAFDPDTYDVITIYLQLLANNEAFTASTDESSFNACVSSTAWGDCLSKIWAVASSTRGDFSATAFAATGTVSGLASSTIGYKWQVIACDDQNACSAWQAFNATTPNFYVDTEAPSPPGNLTVSSRTSATVTLVFGAATNEPLISFSEYKIFYKEGTAGAAETDTPWTQANDPDLAARDYNGTASTIVTGLSSSTDYVFNIWAYDKAGNKASATPEVSTTTSALPFISQSSFRFENDNGLNVNSNTFPEDASTTLENVEIGERLAVRIQIENNGGDTLANNVYKLQFQNVTDAGAWADVGTGTAISYALGLAGTNNDTVFSPAKAEANAKVWRNGSWHENTNQTGAITLYSNEYTELVFMVETSRATTSKTYRFRLYDQTGGRELGAYAKYPSLSTVADSTIRYSKGFYASAPANTADLAYFLDPAGYGRVSDLDGDRDQATSTSNIPIWFFATKHSNNTDAASSTWRGRSSASSLYNNVYLQIFRFGSVNIWITIATDSAAATNTDFTLAGGVNSSLADYYDADGWMYWRVYQASGSDNLQTDYYDLNFAPPVPATAQIHYRWRADDGDKDSASWLEDEDNGSPTSGPEIGRGSTTRLRLEIANTGGGAASNYNFRLEYASSSLGCATDPGGWLAMPVTASAGEHFEMADSAYFADASTTTAQLDNSEGYAFITGDMVEDPSNASANLTLNEGRYTEVEYVFTVTDDADDAQTYCFRVTNGGLALDDYDVFPLVTLSGSTNQAPGFTNGPTDNDDSGASASTSPTEEGADVTFKATASDSENHQYYLAICKSAGIAAGIDAPPTCTGGAWCVSGAQTSGAEASCATTTNASAEVNAWYAYVCDKVLGYGQAKCSAVSQGAGDPAYDSPFVVNRRPQFTAVTTTVDNQDPDENFLISAAVTDNDTEGGADTLRLFVCTTNSIISYAAGCADETLCSEMSTTSPNAACSFATSSPALPGTYDYYAFVFDSHGLAAAPASRAGTYTVNNTMPVLGALSLNNGNHLTLNIRPLTTSVQTINTSVSDLNGCHTLQSAIAAVYITATSSSCVQDANECYQINAVDCVKSDCDGADDLIATFTCTAEIQYFAKPTAASSGNPWSAYKWTSYLQVFDGANYQSTTSNEVEFNVSIALSLQEDTIDFGDSIFAGNNTGNQNSTSTIVNAGNSPIDTYIRGLDLSGENYGGYITVDQIKWDQTNFNYELGIKMLADSDQYVDLAAPRPISTSTDVMDEIYWGIGIPPTCYPDIYLGENIFTVWLDPAGWNL